MWQRAKSFIQENLLPITLGTVAVEVLWVAFRWLMKGLAEDRVFSGLNAWLDSHWSIELLAWALWSTLFVGVFVWAWRAGAKSNPTLVPTASSPLAKAADNANAAIKLSVDDSLGGISPAKEGGRQAKYAQIRVEAGVDLEECEVTILRVARLHGQREEPLYGEQLRCMWSWAFEGTLLKIRIPRGKREHANTIKVLRADANHPHVSVRLETREHPNYLVEELQRPGRYRLRVDARAIGVEPVVASFLFLWESYDDVRLELETSPPAIQPDEVALETGRKISATSVARDVSASEALAFLGFGVWGREFQDAAVSPNIPMNLELRQFHQAAADGDIPVWGQLDKGRVYQPIEKEYWLNNRIEWFSLLNDDPHTEPLHSWDKSQPRYINLMTSRVATERLFHAQPPDFMRAKSAVRQLSNLRDEGVALRNLLLPIICDFDAEKAEGELVAWDEKVVSKLEDARVREGERARFKTLDTFESSLHGASGRGPEQERLEAIWNKKLQILKSIIDQID